MGTSDDERALQALGTAVPVTILNLADRTLADRGTVVLEDLRDILREIAYREGPNGPQAPVTQYLLREGATHLAAALTGDVTGNQDEVPAVLATLVGHDSFATKVLGVSRNQMRRRWPLASSWYADLISYALRPQRYSIDAVAVLRQLPAWLDGPLGDLVARFAASEVASSQDPHLYRLGDTIMTLWPDYPPVRQALQVYRQSILAVWAPVYQGIFARYGLRLADGVGIDDACWVFQALITREGQERRIDPQTRMCAYPGVAAATLSAHAVLMYLAGATRTTEGCTLDHRELAVRMPRSHESPSTGGGSPR